MAVAGMDTKEKILQAALGVFAEKGKHGTRMEEIATKAAVNKAMLYYFYSTKENLFQAVLESSFARIAHRITHDLDARLGAVTDPREKVRIIVQRHFDAFSHNTSETHLLLEAMATNPEDAKRALKVVAERDASLLCPEKFVHFFEECKTNKLFRDIDPRQTLINIIGMNLIYFIAKPISQLLLNLDVTDEKEFLRQRQECVVDMIFHGILQDGSHT